MLIRLSFLAILLLSACSPFQQQAVQLPTLPDNYQQQHSSSAPLPDRWWETFSDPFLNQLQQEMLDGNLDFRQALYRLEQLDALQRISGASLWPSLSINASANRDRSPSATGDSTTDSFRGSLAASYEIDLWNRLSDKTRAAELRQQAGEQEVQTLLLSLSAQLAENYFQTIEKNLQIVLTEQKIKKNEALLASATDRYLAGLATAEEIYSGQSNLAAQQAQLPQLQTALRRNQQAIALLLGRSSSAQMAADQLPEITPLPDIGLPASLLTNRPDVGAALLQLQAADSELSAALADRLPTISLSAAIGQSSTRLASGDINGIFWNLAASLAQPIIDGGRKEAEAERKEAIRDEQLAALEKTLLVAVQDVEIALFADQNSTRRYQLLTQQRDISSLALELSRDNYRTGLINSSQLLVEEQQHLNLLSQLLATQQEWLSNRISLARALGGQWMAADVEKQQKALQVLKGQDNE